MSIEAITWSAVAGLAGGGAAAVMSYGLFAPRSRLFAPVIYRGPSDGEPRIALTFDDGPDPDATPMILDTLAAHHAPACFFVIGRYAEQRAAMIERIDREGHLIGNHTYHHDYSGMFRFVAYWRRELDRTADAVEHIIHKRPRLFRPPMGFKQPLIAWAARRCGCEMITWSRRAFDGASTTTDRILQRLIEPAEAGEILTLHDGRDPHSRRDMRATIDAIAPLIEGLRRRGLKIVRLDELLNMPGYTTDLRTPGGADTGPRSTTRG